MSLLPIIFDNTWNLTRPSRLMDQHFGSGLNIEDLLSPFDASLIRSIPRYYRPWLSEAATKDSGSTIIADKDKFQVNLDVQQFAPEEISVKVSGDNTVTVEGKHEEKQDEHGFISRHFIRRYVLPKGHDVSNISNIESSLSSDGVLSIKAPRIDQNQIEHRAIPIQQTGVPSKAVTEEKGEEKK